MGRNRAKYSDQWSAVGGRILHIIVVSALILSCVVMTGCKKEEEAAPVQAKPVKKAVAPVQAVMTSVKKPEYVYDPTGKRDPFKSFIETVKKVTATRQVALTPLQMYDLGELRLVGVILISGKKVAMVEDPTGKGYNVKEGTLLGKNEGKVVEIKKDEVVVEEKYTDEIARITTRKAFLRIPREQGGEDR